METSVVLSRPRDKPPSPVSLRALDNGAVKTTDQEIASRRNEYYVSEVDRFICVNKETRFGLHNYTIPDTENFGEEKTFPRCHVRTPEVTLPADFSLLVLYCKGPPSKNSIAFLADRSQAIDEAATSNYEP
ncbi:hypothetical protein Cantr_01166 [Candida viswanathii]|uniref:Uncharacterized protein n=1 Tax=Candida viswanathii TaxID=5486 RepID=A0A367YIM2_9ASCO|nr:hypothetical protein Cantr_01166 [Candida viswanathii]